MLTFLSIMHKGVWLVCESLTLVLKCRMIILYVAKNLLEVSRTPALERLTWQVWWKSASKTKKKLDYLACCLKGQTFRSFRECFQQSVLFVSIICIVPPVRGKDRTLRLSSVSTQSSMGNSSP